MDKRKAYALLHPVIGTRAMLRAGHMKRIEQRFDSALYCDAEFWVARIERVGPTFRPEALVVLPQSAIDRMAQIAHRLLVATDCGDGAIEVFRVAPCSVVARRAMMPSEIAALSFRRQKEAS